MKYILSLTILLTIILSSCTAKKTELPIPPLYTPENLVENYFGNTINDPFRGLENTQDTVTLNWFKNQEKYTQEILNKNLGREYLNKGINSLNKKNSVIAWKLKITGNNQYFYLKNTPESDNDKLYQRKDFNGKERLLFDATTYKKNYLINYNKPNYDGSKVAISMTKGDAGIGEMVILDVATKTLHKEIITNCWPSALAGTS